MKILINPNKYMLDKLYKEAVLKLKEQQLRSLFNDLFEWFIEEIDDRKNDEQIIVALDNKEGLVGYLSFIEFEKSIEVLRLISAMPGVGTQLMTVMINIAIDEQIPVYLDSAITAREFYRKLGMIRINYGNYGGGRWVYIPDSGL